MKVLVISDTHGIHNQLELDSADMIIHCGDFSNGKETYHKFIEWYSKLNYKYKILIAGNHDITAEINDSTIKQDLLKKGIIYLKDESIVIEGIKFYGSPWTLSYKQWSFQKDEEDLKYIWDKIPEDTQVLITHSPPKGILDMANYNECGSWSLRDRIKQLKKLQFHLFGHVHEQRGYKVIDNVLYMNATSLNSFYMIIGKPEEIYLQTENDN